MKRKVLKQKNNILFISLIIINMNTPIDFFQVHERKKSLIKELLCDPIKQLNQLESNIKNIYTTISTFSESKEKFHKKTKLEAKANITNKLSTESKVIFKNKKEYHAHLKSNINKNSIKANKRLYKNSSLLEKHINELLEENEQIRNKNIIKHLAKVNDSSKLKTNKSKIKDGSASITPLQSANFNSLNYNNSEVSNINKGNKHKTTNIKLFPRYKSQKSINDVEEQLNLKTYNGLIQKRIDTLSCINLRTKFEENNKDLINKANTNRKRISIPKLPLFNLNLNSIELTSNIAKTTRSIISKCNNTNKQSEELHIVINKNNDSTNKNQKYKHFKEDLKYSIGKRLISLEEEKELSNLYRVKSLKEAGAYISIGQGRKKYLSTDANNPLSKSEAIRSIGKESAFKLKEYVNTKFNIGIDKTEVHGLKNIRKVANIKDKMLIDPNNFIIPNNPQFRLVQELLDKGIRKKIILNDKILNMNK